MSNLKPRIKHLSLAFMGEGWEESYINFTALKWADVRDFDPEHVDNQQAIGHLFAILTGHFVDGKGIDTDGQTLDLTAADLEDLDLETQSILFQRLSGTGDPNA